MGHLENNKPLKGLTLLVLEDELFIAMAVESILKQAGAAEVIVTNTIQSANEYSERQFDASILDVHVSGDTAYGMARTMIGRGTGVVFYSGFLIDKVKTIPDAVVCMKPATDDELIRAVVQSIQNLKKSQ